MTTEPHRVTVSTPNGSYQVLIGGGLLDELPELLETHARAHRYAIVADDRVASLYGARVHERAASRGQQTDILSFPAGELNKNRETWADLCDRMFAVGIGRDAIVLALGGGVVGDLAGFIAATYMRGLPVVQLPTTLLAMIDSSVGGKTGVDTPAGKNLIGAFLQPLLVVADTSVLRTLPVAELRAGMAEAIKHGAIADSGYLSFIETSLDSLMASDEGPLGELVTRSVEIKAEVVGLDEKESGQRKMLNFGHTIGHAIEALSGFQLLHGEAISIGMVVESTIGEKMGITAEGTSDRLAGILARAGLPARVPAGIDPSKVVEATRSDKKARRGQVEYSLIEEIGRASDGKAGSWSHAVDDDTVLEALRTHAG